MKFYRVCNTDTKQGLWYDQGGEFTGLIHNELNFCQNSDLKMDFDEKLVGWLSAVKDLEDLWVWFSKEDIKQLQEKGYFIHEYEVSHHKWYKKFNHWVINQKSSKIIKKIEL